VPCERINKVLEAGRTSWTSSRTEKSCSSSTPQKARAAIADSFSIRREALQHRITYSTTVAGARALVHSIGFRESERVSSLQELHGSLLP
jgi:carbamoyl-phosphate synthase large subunit